MAQSANQSYFSGQKVLSIDQQPQKIWQIDFVQIRIILFVETT